MKAVSQKKKGILLYTMGIVCNLCLSAAKIAVGLFFGFVSMMADGFNNLSDCGSGAVALVSLFIAEKPADREHPFGHRRAEYIAALITGCFVIAVAVELLRESIENILLTSEPAGAFYVYLVLGISVVVKLGMFVLYRLYAKKYDSPSLKAAATDSLCDCIATFAVAVGAALVPYLPSADGWAGIAVSLFILWQGVKLLKEASSKLLGQADPDLAERIKAIFLATDGILGVHDLQVYSYGKDAVFATIHAEMDAGLSMLAAHTVIDGLEMQVKKETGVRLTVHLDPVDLTNLEESRLRIKVTEAARALADGAELHDFRLIPDTNRVEFDVGVPYNCRRTDEELSEALTKIVGAFGDFEPVIRIERE